MDVEIHCHELPCADQHHTQRSPKRIIKQRDPTVGYTFLQPWAKVVWTSNILLPEWADLVVNWYLFIPASELVNNTSYAVTSDNVIM